MKAFLSLLLAEYKAVILAALTVIIPYFSGLDNWAIITLVVGAVVSFVTVPLRLTTGIHLLGQMAKVGIGLFFAAWCAIVWASVAWIFVRPFVSSDAANRLFNCTTNLGYVIYAVLAVIFGVAGSYYKWHDRRPSIEAVC